MIVSHNRQYPIPAPLTLPGAERLMIGEVVCVKKITCSLDLTLNMYVYMYINNNEERIFWRLI